MLNNNLGTYVKSINAVGHEVEGFLTAIGGAYYLQTVSDIKQGDYYIGFTNNFVLVDVQKCSKRLADAEDGMKMYEFDVYKTESGKMFYLVFDYSRSAIVYVSQPTEVLPDNLNIYDCEYIGNLNINTELLDYFSD